MADYPDGDSASTPMAELAEQVQRAIRKHPPDLLLVIDPAAGEPDDTVVAGVTCMAARQVGVPAVVRTGPAAAGAWMIDLGADAAAARAIQRSASTEHQANRNGGHRTGRATGATAASSEPGPSAAPHVAAAPRASQMAAATWPTTLAPRGTV